MTDDLNPTTVPTDPMADLGADENEEKSAVEETPAEESLESLGEKEKEEEEAVETPDDSVV